MMRDGASFATLGSDDGDGRVANESAADGEFEATPMEAACKMLFGEHEAPRMIQALSAARARERDARARSDAETPETQSRKGSMRDLRAVGPPIVRQSSCQSWDWRDDDGSPRESGDRRGPFARNEGESFKRVYSLCVLQHGEPPSLRSDEDDDGKTDSRGGSVSGGAFFGNEKTKVGGFENRNGASGVDAAGEPPIGGSETFRVSPGETQNVAKRARLLDAVTRNREGVAKEGETTTLKPRTEGGAFSESGRDSAKTAGAPAAIRTRSRMNSRHELSAAAAAEPDRAAVARARDAEQAEAEERLRRARGAAAAAELRRPAAAAAADAAAEAPRELSAPRTTTRRMSRESEDSAAMQELRREWASMRGVPARTQSVGGDLACAGNARAGSNGAGNARAGSNLSSGRDDPPSAGAAGLVSSQSAGATSLPSAPRRSTPSIKQRLAEALTPTRAPGELGAWRFNARVTGLNLSNASIGLEGAAFLAEALRPRRNGDGSYSHNGSLRSLNLEFNNLRCEGVALIAEALAPLWVPPASGEGPASKHERGDAFRGRWVANASLERLNLNFCEVGARGAAALAAALAPRQTSVTDAGSDAGRWRHYGGITHLSLFHNRLGAEGARALAEALAPRAQPSEDFAFHPTLRSLNVGRNQLGDVGLARIARAFAPVRLRDGSWQYNPTFKHLHANANSCLSQEGPLALSESLAPRQNPDGKWAFAAALSTIHLANVLLGEEGGRALADVLRPRRCEGVQTAHVQTAAAFTGSGSGDLRKSVWTFPSNLRVLNLSKTGLGDGGAAHVADALRPRREPDGRWTHNPRLRELHLGGATIGPEGAAALADAIRPRRNGSAGVAGVDDEDALESVAGPWGRASLRGFVTPRWSFNTALQVLDLRDNVLGPGGVAALASAVAPVLDQESEEGEASDLGAESDLGDLGAETEEGAETEAMETDFGSPFAARRGARSSDFSSDLSDDRVTPKRWLFGGALAVLNLEFNDAGAEGVAALAEALAPRWRAGPRPNTQLGGFPSAGKKTSAGADAHICAFAFGRGVSGNGSWNTNGTSLPNSRPTSRPTSARLGPGFSGQQGLARDSGGFSSSPGSSLAGSPAVTPRSGSPAPHGGLGTHANDGHARSLPGSAPGSRPQSARSPLAGPGSGREEDLRACAPGLESGSQSGGGGGGGGGGGSAERTDAKSEPLPFWVANESLRALGVGGNRAGDEGAAALAHAVRPRRNPDGSWTATALVKLDASENAIGAEGLLALARAVDPTFAYAFRDEIPSVTLAAVTDPATQAPATTNAIACVHCGKESVARADPTGSASEVSERETRSPRSRCPSTTASSPSSSRQSSRPASGRPAQTLKCECAAPALMLARSFAATTVGGSHASTASKHFRVAGANACASGGTSPRGVVGSGLGSGGATPSPGTNSPVELFHAQARYACDAHSSLRKLDLARNNSDENVRERFNELREKLRRVPSGCDVSI